MSTALVPWSLPVNVVLRLLRPPVIRCCNCPSSDHCSTIFYQHTDGLWYKTDSGCFQDTAHGWSRGPFTEQWFQGMLEKWDDDGPYMELVFGTELR